MELIAPSGYRAVVPFERARHRGLALSEARAAEFAAALGALPVDAAEFFAAGRDHPLVFVPAADDRFLPMAVTGLAPDHNLWLDDDGRWAEGAYIPAYVRRFPFCLVDVKRSADGPPDGPPAPLICVEESALEASERPYIDERGETTERWQPMETLLNEMEAARRATDALAAVLVEHQLLERFEMQAQTRGGEQRRLTNLYRVDEQRLNRLAPKKIKAMMEAGQLSRIYAHLISLENFTRLLDRYQRASAEAG